MEGNTLMSCAGLYRIHRNTIWRWVKQYKTGGISVLTNDIRLHRHWKKQPEKTEDIIIALKERIPGITVRKAQKLLWNKNIRISVKGIWSIWQRYGLTGFARKELSHSYDEYLSSIVSPVLISEIRRLLDANKLHRVADIVNALPLFPYNDIILKIPSHMLSLRRQVNRIRAEFGTIPLVQYREKAHKLRAQLEERGMNYSSLWVVIAECYALMWSGQPGEVAHVITEAKKLMKGMRDARLRFLVLLLEGQAYAGLMKISQARTCVNQCKVITRTSRDPHFFMGGIGGMYSTMGFYREALYWTDKALKGAASSYQQQLYTNIAQFHGTAGDYRSAFRALRKGQLDKWGFQSRAGLIQAYAYLDKGDFQKAQEVAIETLMQIKKEGVRSLLHPITLILASCHRANSEKQKAHTLLKEIIPLLNKYNLKKEYWQRKIMLDSMQFPEDAMAVPALRMVYLLRKVQHSMRTRDYYQAYAYAQKKKILGIFMRLIPFFPEPVLRLLDRGQHTYLPKTFLDMPVFKLDVPVFNVQFLGTCRVLRQGRAIPRMSPKDSAFLIHMALNKNRHVSVSALYHNFWKHTRSPARNLSHLLTRLRKNLAIPSHLIRIQEEMLHWDVFFSTDYELFKEHIAKARFFEQANETEYTIREYKQAFSLYRGAPFKGMYDSWSDNVRQGIMNIVESAKERSTIARYQGK